MTKTREEDVNGEKVKGGWETTEKDEADGTRMSGKDVSKVLVDVSDRDFMSVSQFFAREVLHLMR
jgi:hypothetical protein